MKEFQGNVAVITGAASGIGFAIAEYCAQEGMKVVLADVEEKSLIRAEKRMKAAGASVVAVLTDVSKASDVEALAQKSLEAFGAIHLLFNNAGVGGGASVWESTLADWEWIIGVNLWGVIHGIRTFVPIMLEQATECHIVNTASILGLMSNSGTGIYKVTKHGIVSLSETLYFELGQQKSQIKVSVLCPGYVSTQIMDSERNRPGALKNRTAKGPLSVDDMISYQNWLKAIRAGMSPQQVAECVFQAIRDERFYVIPDPAFKPHIQRRMNDILQERSPTDGLEETAL